MVSQSRSFLYNVPCINYDVEIYQRVVRICCRPYGTEESFSAVQHKNGQELWSRSKESAIKILDWDECMTVCSLIWVHVLKSGETLHLKINAGKYLQKVAWEIISRSSWGVHSSYTILKFFLNFRSDWPKSEKKMVWRRLLKIVFKPILLPDLTNTRLFF